MGLFRIVLFVAGATDTGRCQNDDKVTPRAKCSSYVRAKCERPSKAGTIVQQYAYYREYAESSCDGATQWRGK